MQPDQMFERPKKRHIEDLNIVPILDMMVTVIFFLLLSTTFMTFTKLTVPPAQISSASQQQDKKPPLSPKLVLGRAKDGLKLALSWSGDHPGKVARTVKESEAGTNTELTEAVKALSEDFARKYPEEKSLRIGMGRDVSYQHLISMMDSVQPSIPDVVLISYEEAEGEAL